MELNLPNTYVVRSWFDLIIDVNISNKPDITTL